MHRVFFFFFLLPLHLHHFLSNCQCQKSVWMANKFLSIVFCVCWFVHCCLTCGGQRWKTFHVEWWINCFQRQTEIEWIANAQFVRGSFTWVNMNINNNKMWAETLVCVCVCVGCQTCCCSKLCKPIMHTPRKQHIVYLLPVSRSLISHRPIDPRKNDYVRIEF